MIFSKLIMLFSKKNIQSIKMSQNILKIGSASSLTLGEKGTGPEDSFRYQRKMFDNR